MKGMKAKADQNERDEDWRRIRMKGMRVKADQNERDEDWRRIRMKGMKSEGGSEWKGWRLKPDQNKRILNFLLNYAKRNFTKFFNLFERV